MSRGGFIIATLAVVAVGCNLLTGVSDLAATDTTPPAATSTTNAVDASDVGAALPSLDAGGLDGASIIDSSTSDAPTPDGGYRVFVTSVKVSSNLGGLSGADGICATRALAAGRAGGWVAWLSTKSGVNAIDRVTSPGPWRLFSGELVASSKTQLTSGSLTHAISVDESSAAIVGDDVWTGTSLDGHVGTNDCNGWTNGPGGGMVGDSSSRTLEWTASTTNSCATNARLYCFQN